MTNMRRYQQPSDTSNNWSKYNPILLLGEIGYETDTNKFKIGNGYSNWIDLPYFSSGDGESVAGITVDTERKNIVSDLLGATVGQYSSNSISLGVNSYSDIQSVAIGEMTNAQFTSIALGLNVTSNAGSISIGSTTNAQMASVSVGFNTMSMYGAVAMGNVCTAIGGSVALGFGSNATNSSVALGDGIIASNMQVVLGRYNEVDAEGKYAYILGDGTGTLTSNGIENRIGKNLHTIDHNGNAFYLGKVSIDSNVSILDDGDEYVLVTKKFVQDLITNVTSNFVTQASLTNAVQDAVQTALGGIVDGDNVAY